MYDRNKSDQSNLSVIRTDGLKLLIKSSGLIDFTVSILVITLILNFQCYNYLKPPNNRDVITLSNIADIWISCPPFQILSPKSKQVYGDVAAAIEICDTHSPSDVSSVFMKFWSIQRKFAYQSMLSLHINSSPTLLFLKINESFPPCF